MEFLFDNGERGKERERQREAWKERERGVTEREGYRDRDIFATAFIRNSPENETN